MADSIVVRKQGEGQAYWMIGGLYEVKASSDETGGALCAMEMTLPEGMGPPPHIHTGAEAVFVLEGTLRLHVGDKTIDAGPGSFYYIPKGTLERFEPTSRVRLLIVYTDSPMEKFFAEAGEPAQRREVPPRPTSPPDVERLTAVGARYGLEIKAPAGV